ncbi:DNA gyrase (subunit B) [endosymbiont DhMRE of Dentiscutata heterogama]|uniref:DNA gyrase subunit A n=1 Tax=endosymbiont DhMRE of Dentiscutata heterogama TaxID=1609546 RepID=UPI000629DD0A|nr:DNA gyrase subunit A [endosymbiont DhMRE of Dentiscutata heterogama]CFW93437.1 DNA gyrase (subunit B) [endosymbiont DhMRE of Dentiscutata heterogama]
MPEKKKKKEEYGAESIQVLENIEAVRKRPGMYIGSTDEQGWHHLAWEAIDNPVDEAVAGYCQKIWITLSADQTTITIKDDGRGIPIETHPKTKMSVLRTIFEVLHSGGKFDNKAYKTSGGLHGVGVTVVNALSRSLRVESSREGKTETIIYERGKLISSQITDTPERNNGLLVEFTPDSEIFKEFTYFKVETIQRRLKEIAYLNPNLTFYFATSPMAEPIVYHFTGGLKSWIEELHASKTTLGEIFHQVVSEEKASEYFQLSLAFQYQDSYDKNNIRSFCNNIRTGGGGSHVSGFESGLFEICKELVIKDNPNLEIETSDILVGLTSLVSVRIKNPEFAGQTKDRLANREVREKTKKLTQELISGFFQDNAATAKIIKEKIIDNAKLRLHLKEEQDIFQGGKKTLDLVKVLSGSEENEEIFFVEGKSAGGSAEEGRDVKTQTVLALQGKPPNALKLVRRVLQNKQIYNILLALGFADTKGLLKNNYVRFRPWLEKQVLDEELTLPEEFVYEEEGKKKAIAADTPLNLGQVSIIVRETLKSLLGKSNFRKIILMADPDDDGAHIVILLVTFIFKHLPYLIEGGKLFVAVPPLYRVQARKQIHYFYSDQELETYLKDHPREERKIERIKGLGQIDASELFESTMDPERRRLYNVNIANWTEDEQIIRGLMGTKSDKRKEYLEKRSYREATLTISEDQKIDMGHLALVNFLRYAYAVVEDRALPNVHDGLKPVQRRILFALYQLGITPNKAETTSANIVGKTMSDWHPHGDQGIYNAMTNMVRSDKLRYPLVYGRGNFGYDKNPPAAMRYTKVKLTPYALHLLEDIAYGATDWKNNYDDSKGKEEPVILPTSLPNLLLNGSSGIAVGMTANLPPHNLGETLTATINLIRNPDLISIQKLQTDLQSKNQQIIATDFKREETQNAAAKQSIEEHYNSLITERKKIEEDLLQLKKKINQELVHDLKGPDFPGGGYVLEKEKLPSIYEKGEGTIHLRAKAQIFSPQEVKIGREIAGTTKTARNIIWVTQLPYKVSKSALVARIADLIKIKDEDKKIAGLKKIVDYSNRGITDIRLEFDAQQHDGQIILNKLYKNTQLQISFSVKMRALVGENPKIFSLTEILQAFISNRLENIRRKSQFLWKENEKELVNLNTRLFIINNYQEIAEIIKGYPTEEERNEQLKQKFTEIKQGKIKIENILSMSISFRQFTPEKQADLTQGIADLKIENEKLAQLVASEEKRKEKLIADLEQLKKDYEKDHRRTQIISDSHLIDERKAIAPEEIIIILSRGEKKKAKSETGEKEKLPSYLNIYKINSLEATNIPSVGKELKTRGENLAIIKSNRRDDLWCFSNLGKIYILPVYKLADKSINLRESRMLKLAEGETIEQVISVREDFLTTTEKKEKWLVISTKKGKIKRLSLEKIGRVMKGGKKIINIAKHRDEISQVAFTSGNDDIMVFTKQGKSKSFAEKMAGDFGRAAYGVTAIKLEDGSQKTRCPKHKSLLEQHKAASCCDKSQLGASLRCPRGKEINKEIRNCPDCNKVTPVAPGQAKDEMINFLVVEKELPKNEFNLLAVREDKSGVKKSLSAVFQLAKKRGGKGKKKFRVEEKLTSKYCDKHENSISKLRENWEKLEEKLKIVKKKEEELKEVLGQAQKEQVNPEVIEKYKKELDQIKQEQQGWKDKADKKKKELKNAEEKTKRCADCRKNCLQHEEAKIQHENDKCCDKKKREKEELKGKIEQLQKTAKPSAKKLEKLRAESKELNKQSSKNRLECPKFQALNKEIRNCSECIGKKAKKAVKIIPSHLQKVFLIDKRAKSEIYLLAEEVVCWYNKKDLVDFLQDEKKKRIQLYKGQKLITSLNAYPVDSSVTQK